MPWTLIVTMFLGLEIWQSFELKARSSTLGSGLRNEREADSVHTQPQSDLQRVRHANMECRAWQGLDPIWPVGQPGG